MKNRNTYMGEVGDQVYIEKKGSGEMALYYLVNQKTLHTIDMSVSYTHLTLPTTPYV